MFYYRVRNRPYRDANIQPYEGKNGYLWIKTVDRKLYVFDKVRETFHAVYDDMKDY